ncbi:MAG: type IV secretion system protein VirB10, partial [Steroidobacteraceae bacterium]
MSAPEVPERHSVLGERTIALVHRARSLESRLSNWVALGMMGALGCALLAWYYTAAAHGPAQSMARAKALAANEAASEMPLPPLGPIPAQSPAPPPMSVAASRAAVAPEPAPQASGTLRPSLPICPRTLECSPSGALPLLPLVPSRLAAYSRRSRVSARAPGGATAAQSGAEKVLQRQLSGPAFARESGGSGAAASPVSQGTARSPMEGGAGGSVEFPASAGPRLTSPAPRSSRLSALLTPSLTPTALATVLPSRNLVLPKGSFIDCTLETAIDSTLPGMTTCITATDTFGADGKVVLLERGSKLIGETRGVVAQGSARVFVLWTEARTPTGVVIPLASPGTDELGRSGLPGKVNHHFWERFGAAMLISIIDAGAESAMQAGNGAVLYDPTASESVASGVLKQTLQIPPTVVKHQGDRIQVLVARDLDFRSVYE